MEKNKVEYRDRECLIWIVLWIGQSGKASLKRQHLSGNLNEVR